MCAGTCCRSRASEATSSEATLEAGTHETVSLSYWQEVEPCGHDEVKKAEPEGVVGGLRQVSQRDSKKGTGSVYCNKT